MCEGSREGEGGDRSTVTGSPFTSTRDGLGGRREEQLACKLGKAAEQLSYYRWVLMKDHVFTRQKRKKWHEE